MKRSRKEEKKNKLAGFLVAIFALGAPVLTFLAPAGMAIFEGVSGSSFEGVTMRVYAEGEAAPAEGEATEGTNNGNCVSTAILGDGGQYCDNGGNDGGVVQLLLQVVDIMTAGVAILAVVGVMWAGLKYLTAGGSEEKTRIAKRRIYEIVIGIVAYVLIYAILRWLLPSLRG